MKLVDWRLAEATAARLVPPGPHLPLEQAVATVEQLRELAAEAEGHVRRHTGLARGDGAGQVVVVDRPGWVRNNIEGFADLIDPLLETAVGSRAASMGPIATAIGPRATGLEVGAMLAYLSSRVLGQFELFGPATADTAGRLTLVAPNIVSAEQSLGVDPRDFRLWVCLHEVTHRIQFAAAPWLREHVRGLLREYLEATDLEPAALLRRLRDAVGGAASSLRSADAPSLIELVQTPRQREVLDRVTGLMSLLEGHADVVMDGVGPHVVPSVESIRERFERRRRSGSPLDRAVRRLLGLDLKLKQYREGAEFVRAVVGAVGMDGLNRVWSGADLLPDAADIRDPHRWLARIDGLPPAATA